MSSTGPPVAFAVADPLRHHAAVPWEIFGERLRRFELHLNGDRVETARGPIDLQGFGLRVFRTKGEQLGVGHFASTDLSDSGVRFALEQAETAGRHSRFPASTVELPGGGSDGAPPELVDRRLWESPVDALEEFVHTFLEASRQPPDVAPSFGSVRATLCETSVANSSGLRRQYRHTLVELEVAVKSSGGPEGGPPGEYWVNHRARRLPTPAEISAAGAHWATVARDVRRATAPPAGVRRVVLPPEVLADVLPSILGFRLSGAARLRDMMPEPASQVGAERLTIRDDGRLAFGLGSAPCDDEGTAQQPRAVIQDGRFQSGFYDALHAASFGVKATGNARRDSAAFQPWFHFDRPPAPQGTNLAIGPGDAGELGELAEAVGDGLYVEQLGYAFPDAMSGAFGGEIRAGYRIRGGKLAEPVRGGTVGGMVIAGPGEPSLLGSIQGIGRDVRLVGYLSCPTLWVDGLEVAGSSST